jgi:uncharacterized protein (TIGR00255 family)
MIRSMTGYGVAEAVLGETRLTAEIRSVNGRYSEVSVRLPRTLASLEQRVRKLLQDRIGRGRISMSLTYNGEDSSKSHMRIDERAADRYHSLLNALKERYGLKGNIELATMVGLPDVFVSEQTTLNGDDIWGTVEDVVGRAAAGVKAMREREGRELATDLIERTEHLRALVAVIEERAPLRVAEGKARLEQRLSQLLGAEGPVDPSRLASEVALMADRLDCTEECVRLRGHCSHLLSLIESEEAAGRKLNFLLQEMNREANTIGAKASDLSISEQVILIKEELEKIREQAQNIE